MQPENSNPHLKPKRPSPMMAEPSMKEGILALTPRWVKRLSRKRRADR
jgi:hypothetical protein